MPLIIVVMFLLVLFFVEAVEMWISRKELSLRAAVCKEAGGSMASLGRGVDPDLQTSLLPPHPPERRQIPEAVGPVVQARDSAALAGTPQ
jgi:hypothetical protein